MGVSKVGGGGKGSPPNGWRSLVLGEGGPCRVWRSRGFPKLSRKIFPLKPFPPIVTPFSPPRPPPQFLHPSKPSLQLSRLGLLPLSTPPTSFFLLQNLPYSFQPLHRPLLNPLRTPSESLNRVPKRPQKAQKQPFLGLFRGTPKTPKKGLRTPFLTPFSPLPYPL